MCLVPPVQKTCLSNWVFDVIICIIGVHHNLQPHADLFGQ